MDSSQLIQTKLTASPSVFMGRCLAWKVPPAASECRCVQLNHFGFLSSLYLSVSCFRFRCFLFCFVDNIVMCYSPLPVFRPSFLLSWFPALPDSLSVSQFCGCIRQRSIWRPITSQRRVTPVFGGCTAAILLGLTYPKILWAPEKEKRKTENGDIACRRSSLSQAWAAEIVT